MAPSGAGWAQRCGEEGTWPRGGGRGPDPEAGVLPAGAAVSSSRGACVCGSGPAVPRAWSGVVGRRIGAPGETRRDGVLALCSRPLVQTGL